MDTTEQRSARLPERAFPTGLALRAGIALAAATAAISIAALNEHAPLDVQAGPTARFIAALVPVLTGILVALSVWRPWRGFLAVLLLTPVVNVGQISWTVGSLQIIAQTIFLVALAVGLLLESGRSGIRSTAQRIVNLDLTGRAAVPVVAASLFVVVAVLSTLSSPDLTSSSDVLIHGLLEPIGMGLVLLLLRPTRSMLIAVAIVLGVSVGIGGLLNIVQTIPGSTLASLQARRLLFSRITYFNVGLFAEMVAMAVPLLAAALIGRKSLHLSRWTLVAVAAALVLGLVSLFFTFSKSGYLAAAVGLLVLFLLVVRTWRRRAAILVTAALVSTLVVPWPELVLGPVPVLANAYRSAVTKVVGQSRFDSWNPATLSGRGSLVERFYATEAAFEMAINHPQLGVGLNQFKTEYVNSYKPAEARLDLDSAHSMWAEISAELGFPALFLLLTLYGSAFAAAWLVYRRSTNPAARLTAAAWLAAMLAWFAVATAFAGDMYRSWRNMSSDFVMMAIIVAGAFALYRATMLARPAPSSVPVDRAD